MLLCRRSKYRKWMIFLSDNARCRYLPIPIFRKTGCIFDIQSFCWDFNSKTINHIILCICWWFHSQASVHIAGLPPPLPKPLPGRALTYASGKPHLDFWPAYTVHALDMRCDTVAMRLSNTLHQGCLYTIQVFIGAPYHPSSGPEFIDPVFVKTSPKRSFSVVQNERFELVFVKTGSIISGTGGVRFQIISLYLQLPISSLYSSSTTFAWHIVGTICWLSFRFLSKAEREIS